MSQILRVVMAQLNLRVGDVHGNVERVIEAAANARDQFKADLIVFPELTLCGYPPEDLLLRSSMQRRIEQALQRLRDEVRGIYMVVGYPWLEDEQRFNACAVIADGELLGRYFKQKLPNYRVFDEKRYFIAGNQPCVIEIKGVPVALTICEDIWYAEPVRQAREAGARLMLSLNASPFHLDKQREREEVLAVRAREGGMPIVYVTRCITALLTAEDHIRPRALCELNGIHDLFVAEDLLKSGSTPVADPACPADISRSAWTWPACG